MPPTIVLNKAKSRLRQVFDTAELGPLHATQQHHRQLQAIAQSHSSTMSGTYSLPPSPAPSNAVPAMYTSRMDREASASSTGFPSAPGSVSATPSPFVTKAELGKFTSEGEIFGLPVGSVPVSRPPSSLASSVVDDGPAPAPASKRPAEELEDVDAKQKKRRIDLTKG